MEQINSSSLKRDNNYVKTLFLKKGNATICKRDCYVLLPDTLVNKGLAEIENPVKSVCILAIVEGNKYATMAIPVKQSFSPHKIEKVLVDGDLHYKLYFTDGDFFFIDNSAICDQSYYFEIFELFYLLGKVPFYLNYSDVSNLFLEAKRYGNSKIGDNRIAWDIIAGLLARDPNNPKVFYKDFLHKDPANIKVDPVFKGFKDVYFSYDNTSSKLIGGYLEDGIIGAVIDPETKTSKISEVLRA